MNREYIYKTINAYLIDRELDNSKFEEFNDYMIESMNYMKENYECAYVTVHNEMSKIQQQRYIYNVLDNKDLELSEESVLLGLPEIILLIVLSTVGLHQYGHKPLKAATSWFIKTYYDFHKFLKLKDWFKEHEVVNRILDSNFSDCSKKAGFDESHSKLDKMIALKPKPIKFLNITNVAVDLSLEDIARGEGLRDCYLDYMVSAIASVSVIYVKCIEDTGEVKQQVSTDHGMGALLNFPTGEGCQVLYDQLKDLHNAFSDTLDVFFKDDSRERRNWSIKLDEKVRGAKRGEHLRPTIPKRGKSSFEQGRFVHTSRKRFTGNQEINPTAPMDRR